MDLQLRFATNPFGIRASLFPLAAALCLGCSDSSTEPEQPEPRLTLELRFLDPVTPQQRSVFDAAVEKWTRALFKDLGDFRLSSSADHCFAGAPALDETHHNPLVFISIIDIDGAGGEVASARVCNVSERDGLPILSRIRLDRADISSMETAGILPRVVTHELGHALGFTPSVYLPKNLAGSSTFNDPYFNGSSARAEFVKTGAWYTGPIVPLDASPYDPHWRYSVFGDEIMSGGWSGDPAVTLSSVTLGLFKDLGYEVDFSVADPYEVGPVSNANRSSPAFNFSGDVPAAKDPIALKPLVGR